MNYFPASSCQPTRSLGSGRSFSWFGRATPWFNPAAASTSKYVVFGAPLKTGGSPAGYLDGVAALDMTGTGATAGNPVQSTSGRQPICLPWDAAEGNYLHFPGVAGNYASVPDAPAVSDTTGLDVRCCYTMPTWTPATYATLAAKRINATGWSFAIGNAGSGLLYFTFWDSVGGLSQAVSTAPIPFAAISTGSVRAVVAGAAGNWTVDFYYSPDANTETAAWTQLGSQRVGMYTGMLLPDNSFALEVGSISAGMDELIRGACRRVSLRNGSGAVVLNINFADAQDGAASFVCETGQTVTINQTGNNPATLIGHTALRFDGVDDFLEGDFAGTVSSGRMFAVFRLLGNGGTLFGRVFAIRDGAGPDHLPSGFIYSLRNNGVGLHSYRAGFLLPQSEVSPALHEVLAADGNQMSRINNANEVTNTWDISTVSAEKFNIGGLEGDLVSFAAFDLLHLALIPADETPETVALWRRWYAREFPELNLPIP